MAVKKVKGTDVDTKAKATEETVEDTELMYPKLTIM